MSDPTHPVRLTEERPGQWVAHHRGYDLTALKLDGVWVCYIDELEQFSAYRLATAERKFEEWFELEAAVR